MESKMTPPPALQQKTFLQLPAEIRCQIYDATFRQIPHCFYQRDGRRHIMRDDHLKLPALCQASRQIYSESLSLFYGTSDCHIQLWPKSLDNDGPDLKWLGPADSSRMRMFGRIKITSEAFTLAISQQAAGSILKLESLHFYRCQFPAMLIDEAQGDLEPALWYISNHEKGFTPQLLKRLIHYVLYLMWETQVLCETRSAGLEDDPRIGYDAMDFLMQRAKLERRHFGVVKDLLSLSPSNKGPLL